MATPTIGVTLRLDPTIYRAAQAMAARLGVSVTAFIQEAIRQATAGKESGR